ncbi:SDR family oxidoreductase [Microaerobacter geothermalis]|uniref:SDR family oxidoreductase n=1 Tax=Microaerobacter geothermalis TaxID=674972 RepID=UPI001F1F4A13|nr:SDR family oxidoreductase [Microaerobacter geothermalis]MCF6095047.1 SDR family oxidoreductase [Microaerobacter geothermalis]
MSNVYFFTGFPGFIASRLIQSIIDKNEDATFHLLVHPSQIRRAASKIHNLTGEHSGKQEQFILHSGDIRQENLGLEDPVIKSLRKSITYVFHLAAIYDLAVPKNMAYEVNVKGTHHVNLFVKQMDHLKRYVYFSTAYVSGNRTGRIMEEELDRNQSFKNHYESTKFEAEKLVQDLREEQPTTIIRPGIVIGDSKTGETAKFDGPYFIMRFFDRFRHFPIPYIGRGEVPINLVPVDYVIESTIYLAHSEKGVNKTYHLADPSPYKVREVYQWMCQELLNKSPIGLIPKSFVYGFLSIPFIRQWVKVEKETLDYFDCFAQYDTAQTEADLEGSGIHCPDLRDYISKIVSYYQEHRNDPEKMIPVR